MERYQKCFSEWKKPEVKEYELWKPAPLMSWLTRVHYYMQNTSLMAQQAKNLPAMQEVHIQSLGWEDPLEKEMTTHACILA